MTAFEQGSRWGRVTVIAERFLMIGASFLLVLMLVGCGGDTGSETAGDEPAGGEALEDDQAVEEGVLEAQVEVGDSLADVPLTLLDGSTVQIDDYEGRVLLLFFWSTDMVDFILRQLAVHNRYLADEGLAVIGVNSSGEPVASIENYIDEFPNQPVVALDEDQRLMDMFAAGLATAVWIGPQSDLKSINRSFKQSDLTEENMRYRLDAYLNASDE